VKNQKKRWKEIKNWNWDNSNENLNLLSQSALIPYQSFKLWLWRSW